ncbi:MAG: cytochrome c [Bacteroidia bacterium]|nr:cytochrome c [Bacteroidia bacterium]MDW8088526.1 cytochrome c [Bacteroidia bacterium]
MRYGVLSFFLFALCGRADTPQGQVLFAQRCAACHKLEAKLIGPPLAQIGQRRSEEWFYRFVANSQSLIQAGDPQAVAVYREYNQQVMPPFADLSSAELKALWDYLNSVTLPSETKSEKPKASSEAIYPGQARSIPPKDWAFLKAVFWGLAGAVALVTLLLGFLIHVVSVRRSEAE